MKPIAVLEDLNHKACSYIKSYLSTHSKEEFEIAAFDLDKEIEHRVMGSYMYSNKVSSGKEEGIKNDLSYQDVFCYFLHNDVLH